MQSNLSVGLETLAESFGDLVYLRVRRDEVECLVCGCWVSGGAEAIAYACTCGVIFLAKYLGEWAAISTQYACTLSDVLFLPREWNKEGPYITATKLRAMYAQFDKERNECNLQVQAVKSA